MFTNLTSTAHNVRRLMHNPQKTEIMFMNGENTASVEIWMTPDALRDLHNRIGARLSEIDAESKENNPEV